MFCILEKNNEIVKRDADRRRLL